MSWDHEVDFVSIGSGLGGVTAAIHIAELGGTALILEKAPKLGGVCAYSGGEVFVYLNHVMQDSDAPDKATNAGTCGSSSPVVRPTRS